MLKKGQTYIKDFAVWTPQDFKNKFGYFSILWLTCFMHDLALVFINSYHRVLTTKMID